MDERQGTEKMDRTQLHPPSGPGIPRRTTRQAQRIPPRTRMDNGQQGGKAHPEPQQQGKINLKQYLSVGLTLTKVHRGVKFLERDWTKGYIQLNTDLRTKGTTDFEKDFLKLMNNYVFGKTMVNVRNRVDIRMDLSPYN